jgi:hypothetical protein
MPGFHGLQQPGLVELFPSKGPDGLEHSQQLMVAQVPRQERGFDQFVDPAEYVGFVWHIPGTDSQGLFFVEGAGEYGQPLQNLAAVRVEKVVRPFEGVSKRLLAARPAPEVARVKIKGLCHSVFNALQGKPAQMTGRNLDGEGNVFEIGANPLDEGEIIRRRLKPSIGQSASFYEQANGRGLAGAVLRTGIQRGDLVERLTLHPKRAPAGVDQKQPATGRT